MSWLFSNAASAARVNRGAAPLHAEGWVLPVSASPKPPAERITLTMPVLNAAKNVAVVALGKVCAGRRTSLWQLAARGGGWSSAGLVCRASRAAMEAGVGLATRLLTGLPSRPAPHPAQGKAEVVQRALEVQSLPGALPVQLVQPQAGRLTWILDQGSAEPLRIADWEAGNKKFPRSENPPKAA